jgi:hypothetical protein
MVKFPIEALVRKRGSASERSSKRLLKDGAIVFGRSLLAVEPYSQPGNS